MTKAVHLKWTDKGVEGVKALIAEIEKFSYTSLEVLDLSDLHMGDEGCLLLAKMFSQGWSFVNVFHFYSHHLLYHAFILLFSMVMILRRKVLML